MTPDEPLDLDLDKLVRDGVLTRDDARALQHSQQSDTDGAMRLEALPSGENKDAVKEDATKHKRHWVRTTRLCNQRCTFCLDSMNQDGTMIDFESLKAYILLGKRMGRERLILSGGEASVHPKFIELIRYGRQVGYEWIQTITNGMMFSYTKFAKACADAGLNEATVSMHGHTAQIHDKLTGTPGAFVTGIKGMQNLMATGKVVVNIDVVLNKQNYKVLPEVLDFYYNMGIREFDLLHIIPFGRGFDEHRHSLFFDLNDAVPYFRRAFQLANRPGVYLWTNRLPVMYLEGFERLIQDPHKLLSEFDGGRHNFEGWLRKGMKPDCHGERCDYCFLDGPCRQTMFPFREQLEAGTLAEVRIDAQHVWQGTEARAKFEAQKPERVWLAARTAQDALGAMDHLPFAGSKLAIELDPGADPAPLAVRAIERYVVHTIDDAQRYLATVPAAATIEVRLTQELATWLLAQPDLPAERLVATLQDHAYMSESQAIDPSPAVLAQLAHKGVRLKNVPRCVAGAPVEPGEHLTLDAKMLDGAGALDLDRYVASFIGHEYAAKSLRCGRCAEFEHCRGAHINYLRSHGFAILTPLDEDGRPLADAASFEHLTEQLKAQAALRSKRDQQRLHGLHKPVATQEP